MYLNRKGVQFSNRDTWSLDHTLSPIILSALLKFKVCSKDRKGIPCSLLCDLFPETMYDHTEEQLEQASKEWESILDKMIYSFNLKNEPKIEAYNFKFIHEAGERLENGSRKFSITHTNDDEYQRYRRDEKEHEEKVKEGHLLFGKYYQNLWW